MPNDTITAPVERPLSSTPASESVEGRLLEFFRAHSGRVLLRDDLSWQIWEYCLDPRSRVIDQTVSLVRKQLDAGEHITTVPGQGYRHHRKHRGPFTSAVLLRLPSGVKSLRAG